jgi:hypothetical protein
MWNIDSEVWPGPAQLEDLGLRMIDPLKAVSFEPVSFDRDASCKMQVSEEVWFNCSVGEIVALAPDPRPFGVIELLYNRQDEFWIKVRIKSSTKHITTTEHLK